MSNILYLIDNTVDTKKFFTFLKNKKNRNRKITHLYLCPMTVDNVLIDQITRQLSQYGNVEILPFVKKFQENALLNKDKFIKFISDFSKESPKNSISLRRYFINPFDGFSMWWLSLVAEKNTVKKGSYHNLAKLITILDFQRDYFIDEIFVDIDSEPLKKSLVKNNVCRKVYLSRRFKSSFFADLIFCWMKAIGYTVFFALRKLIIYALSKEPAGKRRLALKNAKLLFVTYFPYADKNDLRKKVYKSKYFGPLQSSAEKRYNGRISWIGMLQDNSKLNVDAIRLATAVNRWGQTLFLPEELISFREIIKSFILFLYINLKYLMKIPYLSRHFVFKEEEGINIWHLYCDEWNYSFFGSYLIGGILYYRLFSNAISRIKNEAVILYPAELQAWENALNIARGDNRKIKTVGIQHTTVGQLTLSYFNLPSDFKTDDKINAFPMPDYLATSGKIPMELLTESGWPRERVFDLGAIRYHKLTGLLKKKIPWNTRDNQVVVVLSSAKPEAEEMLLMLWQAFKNKDIPRFLIKPHPTCPVEDITKPAGFNSLGGKFVFETERPLEEILLSSRAVIVGGGSTASLDGIACQCPVIIPKLSCSADMNPLSALRGGLAKYVTSINELAEITRAIVNSQESPLGFDECKSLIKDYFTLYDNEDSYFLRFEKELLNK